MSAKADPEALELRARPRPVTRLNRRMLIGVIAALVGLILGVTVWSLQPHLRLADVRPELHNVDRITRADAIDRLPPDYSKVAQPKPVEPAAIPQLGKPLPGDLGMAMFRAEHGNAAPLGHPAPSMDARHAEQANREREADDAAKAPLFFQGSSQKTAAQTTPESATPAARTTSASESEGTAAPNASATRPTASARSDAEVVSRHTVQSAISPYQVMAGTVISAALITGINSDLPGVILATVTEPIFDTKLGRYLLIPQGTRLIGEYDSQVAFGQRRILLVWNRMIFPDASSLSLDRLPGVDNVGNAGLEDGVDRHWRQLLAGAALSTLIGVAAELAAPDRNSNQIVVSAQQSVQESINHVGQELTRRNLNVQPTLTIRAGHPVRVIVSRDLVLRPYQPLFIQRSEP